MLKRKHWIITRFNVGLYQRPIEEVYLWMDKRLELFRKFTVPSLKNQTCKDFEWLLILDEKTDKTYIGLINMICSGMNYRIETISDFGCKKFGERTSIGGVLSECIRKVIINESKNSIQTRMDNDDAYSKNMVEYIQKDLVGVRPRAVVDYFNGYIFDSVNNKMYEAEHYEGSPWISLFSDNSTGETVYDNIHYKYRRGVIKNTRKFKAWMMVVHGGNVSNKLIDRMAPKEVDCRKVLSEWQVG